MELVFPVRMLLNMFTTLYGVCTCNEVPWEGVLSGQGRGRGCVFISWTLTHLTETIGLPWWLSGKESACREGEMGAIPGLGRSPGGGNGNPLQSSCLGNPMDREVWQATVHGVIKESDTT